MTGSAVQWLGEFLNLPDPASAVAQLAASIDGAAGVYFVPAMLGLGAPYWDANAADRSPESDVITHRHTWLAQHWMQSHIKLPMYSSQCNLQRR